MAHYALLNDDNIVVDIITGRNEGEVVSGISDWEAHYSQSTGVVCKRTSYNTYGNQHLLGGTLFRKNFAVPGYVYDENRDAFIPPQPYPSWVLNEDTCLWDAPVPRPDDGQPYAWNEDTVSWVQIELGD